MLMTAKRMHFTVFSEAHKDGVSALCRHHGYDEAMIQFTKSLSGLAVEYVDLFLLHYPSCWPGLCGEDFVPKGTWHDSWRALESLYDKGLVRAIGALTPALTLTPF